MPAKKEKSTHGSAHGSAHGSVKATPLRAHHDKDYRDPNNTSEIEELERILEEGPVTAAFIYADWCPHCHQYRPTWEKLMRETPGRVANMVSINEEVLPATSLARASIDGYPSVVIIDRGNSHREYKNPASSGGSIAGLFSNSVPTSTNGFQDIYNETKMMAILEGRDTSEFVPTDPPAVGRSIGVLTPRGYLPYRPRAEPRQSGGRHPASRLATRRTRKQKGGSRGIKRRSRRSTQRSPLVPKGLAGFIGVRTPRLSPGFIGVRTPRLSPGFIGVRTPRKRLTGGLLNYLERSTRRSHRS